MSIEVREYIMDLPANEFEILREAIEHRVESERKKWALAFNFDDEDMAMWESLQYNGHTKLLNMTRFLRKKYDLPLASAYKLVSLRLSKLDCAFPSESI